MQDQTLICALLESFSKYHNKTAIKFYNDDVLQQELSFSDLDLASGRAAAFLQKMNVKKGDRVILNIPKSISFVIAHLAILRLNAISVPLNPGFKEGELTYLIHDAKAKLAICGPEQEVLFNKIDPALPTIKIDPHGDHEKTELMQCPKTDVKPAGISSDDPALIIYTSGTTGHPKGAVLTQKNLLCDALNVIRIWKIDQTDILCHALPLFHIHGLSFALTTALLAGAQTIMLDAFKAENVVSHLSSDPLAPQCTLFMAVPSMYAKLLDLIGQRTMDFSNLRLITSGSAPLLPKDFKRIKTVFGREPVEREGMSETGMNFSNPVNGTKKPGSIGLPLPGLDVKIVNPENFESVPNETTGEIWLKSPSIIKSYWQKPEETKKAFVNDWFRTGDLGYMDRDGYYYLTDRIKNIIISGGENISPKEIENVINAMDSVTDSAVVGLADEKWGEKVVAAVVLKPDSDLTPETIVRHLKSHLHPWKCPKQVIITKQLPRNTMGKILTGEVRKFFD